MTESPNPSPDTQPPPRNGSFWAELKRRKVMRVAITYAVAGWIVMQVGATVFPNLGIPQWVLSALIVMVLLGFPLAVILAWAFELTPDGIKTTRHAREAQGEMPLSEGQQKKRNWMALAFAAGLPTLIFGALALFFFQRAGEPEIALEDKSIAVLPFTAFASGEDERFFADGLSDTLLHKLAQLSDIRVIARSSSFQYRGDSVDIQKVGEELNVATVLEGSVQRSGDQLRIIAQLIRTVDGGHIWSKTFDRSAKDTFAIQDEIAEAVVASLRVQTNEEEKQRLEFDGTTSVEAYTLLTLIRERANSSGFFNIDEEAYEKEMLQRIAELDKVLKIDPNYAEVYREKASWYDLIMFRGTDSRDLYLRKGFEAIRQAMLLDPENPVNFTVYGRLARRSGDPVTGESFLRLALNRAPNDAEATFSLLLCLLDQDKNPEEVLELSLREEALGDIGFMWRRRVFALAGLNRNEEALEVILEQLRGDDLVQIAAIDLARLQSGRMGQHVDTMRELISFRKRLADSASSTFWEGWFSLIGNVGLMKVAIARKEEAESGAWQEPFEVYLLWEKGQYQEIIDWLDAKGWDWRSTRARSHLMLSEFEKTVEYIVLEKENLGEAHPYLIDNDDFRLALPLVVSLRALGETEAAERLLDAVEAYVASRNGNGLFNPRGYSLCVLHLIRGEAASALEEMGKRIYLDGDDFVPLNEMTSFSSPEYKPLQNDPTFKKLVSEYERRRTASAEKVEALIEAAGY